MKWPILLCVLGVLLLVGCVNYPQVRFTGMGPISVNTTNLSVSFTATDDRDLNLTYMLYLDNVIEASGTASNGTVTTVPIQIQSKPQTILKVVVIDKTGNSGLDYVTINLRDSTPPVVTIISVTQR